MTQDMPKEELLDKVKEALDGIRPYLVADGGDVKLLDIDENNIVQLELLGACGSCPMSPMTMKAGVEEAIKRIAPEVNGVNAVNVPELN